MDDLDVTIAGFILSHCLPDVSAVQPVNRYFSAESPKLQPDLECLVGMDSADVSELYKVKWKNGFKQTFIDELKVYHHSQLQFNKPLYLKQSFLLSLTSPGTPCIPCQEIFSC